MKYIITALAFFILSSNSYSFNESLVKIYTSQEQILTVTNFTLNNNHRLLFIGKSAGQFYTSYSYSRLDKNTNTIISPYRGMIGKWCTWVPYPPGVICDGLGMFAISRVDTSFMIMYRASPGAECPDARTYITYDAGISYIPGYFGCGGIMVYPDGIEIDPVDDNIVYFVYPDLWSNMENFLWKSTNKGNTFQQVSVMPPDFRNLFNYWEQPAAIMRIVPFQRNHILIVGDSATFLSTNNGANFTKLSLPKITGLVFDEQNEIVFAYKDHFLYKSNDAGATWSNVVYDFKFNFIEISPDNASIMYAGSVQGLHRSTDTGESWALYNNTFLPSKNVIGISKDPGTGDTLYAVTQDGIYKVWADMLTDIVNTGSFIPEGFALSQNYPNPFNPTTKIKFSIPARSDVRLFIYNSMGQLVSELVDKSLNAGEYEVEFNAQELSSGIYFYTLHAVGEVFSRKMLLVK